MNRRTFLQAPLAAGALPAAIPDPAAPNEPSIDWKAQWIWYPEQRTISGTFVLFRRKIDLASVPASAPAWVTGHSRYQLWVNGKFVQRGPAPCDPRYWDVDPVDIAPYLQQGPNVIAAIVCFFGGGDGTYVPPGPDGSGEGKGFLFQCDALGLITDGAWRTSRPRCWKHGSYQRWFLRALQEEFDARHYPDGWSTAAFDDSAWKPALVGLIPPGRPNISETPREGWHDDWRLQPRTIPALKEELILCKSVSRAAWIDWRITPEEYFECFTLDSYSESPAPSISGALPCSVPATGSRGLALTFDFGKEMVGHPYVRLHAPAGTVVEIIYCEKQAPGKLLLRPRPRYGQWLRVVCGQGITEYEAFEYDAFQLMQLHIHGATGPVEIIACGVKQRDYAWAHEPDFHCSDSAIQRACQASINTHRIVSQDTLVDNVTRERQQYAGDLDQAKLASYYAFGETRQPARVLRTFGQGQSREGWFMDCWPAWDRCQRLYQKHMELTQWGPIIDHALQYGIAIAEHHLWTGDKALLAELTPRMALFDSFLQRSVKEDGLLPVEHWIWNCVWIDHIGFHNEQDKHCALNLYWAGFLTEGLARLLEWNGQRAEAVAARKRAAAIVSKVKKLYWSGADVMFVENLPRRGKDGAAHVHARTISMAVLFGQMPAPGIGRAAELLAAFPTTKNDSIVALDEGRVRLGFNYPLNDIWRLWALGRLNRPEVIVKELRERWASLPSVLENMTYAEFWNPRPSESGDVWCQSNPVPVVAFYQEILGVRPTAPGFTEYQLRPRPGGLESASGTVWTPQGRIHISVKGSRLEWTHPAGTRAVLVMPNGSRREVETAGTERKLTIDLV